MALPHMSSGVARDRLETPITDVEADHRDIEELPGPAQACIQSLARIRGNLPDFTDHVEFDAAVAVRLHESADLPLVGASDLGFWRWLAVEHGRDLVEFRYGENANLANYGIGRQWENLFMRAWFRADLSCDATRDDPYSLTRYGGSDFWATNIRHRYSSARNIMRALIRFQFVGSDPLRGRLNTTNVRELYKRIQLIHATISLELLTDAECDDLLEELASDLV